MLLAYEERDVTTTLGTHVNVQCISEDCAMGAGVVVAYSKIMPKLKENCIEYMKKPVRNNKGVILPYKYTDGEKEIYNMFTKEKYWHNAFKGMKYSEYIYRMEVSLRFIRGDMIKNGQEFLAMPKIGCGRDRLDWKDVERLIFDIFKDTSFEILVCEYCERR